MTNKKKPTDLLQQNNSISIEKINEPIKVEIKKTSSEKESFLRKNGVAMASGIISIIALCFTFWQSGKIREHNKLSVTPLINLSYFNNFSDNSLHIKLKNKGTGPAIIDDMIFISNSKKEYFTSELQGQFWESIFKAEIIPDSIVYKNILTYHLVPGDAVSTNEEIEIFGFNPLMLKPEVYISELTKFSNCKIIINYHSIYNTPYSDSLYFKELKVTSFF